MTKQRLFMQIPLTFIYDTLSRNLKLKHPYMNDLIFSPNELCRLIGRRAKERRLTLGIRQTDLSAKSGVPLSTLRRFEAGEGSLETVARVAFALHAEREFQALFPPHDARSLDDVLRANQPRKRARR